MLRSQAITAENNKDWHSAAQYYARLYYRDSTNIKLQYSFADMSRLDFDLDVALRLYVKTAKLDNGKKFPLTFYWIGEILKHKQRYKEAKQWFVKFNKLELKKDKYRYYKMKSKVLAESCDLAQILMKYPVMPPPEHLDATINSKASEYAPIERDSALYFSSLRVPERKPVPGEKNNEVIPEKPTYSKIYRSDIKNQKLKKIKVLDTLINSNYYHTANTCFNADFDEMIISRCSALNAADYRCELYISKFDNKKWRLPQKMEEPVNQPSVSTTQPDFGMLDSVTVLFFASDRPGGEGGLDIWYCKRNGDGTYGKAINAGKKINTPDDEVTPWFVNNTLYFSSTYHQGLGGFDVFKSEFRNHDFTDPVNAGYPVNSSYNDLYFSTNNAGNHLYVSSNRPGSLFDGKMNCCNDIFRFTIDTTHVPPPAIDSMVIVKEQLKLLVPLTLYFHNDSPDPQTKATTTKKNYETTYYEYVAMQPQYIEEFSKELKGDKKAIAINNIDNFFKDSLEAGYENLNRFADLLQKVLLNGETVKITMKGYCSPLASTDYNVNLAQRRISSLRNYFMEAKNGFFVKYVNNTAEHEGKIIFEDVDIGELKASKVSDDYKDKRNSVYSPYAAFERKIQIIAVSYGK
jgi:hypothetical protein